MAQLTERLPQNVPGDFFVDGSCIDCDACRQIAPGVFKRADTADCSYVHQQPRTDQELRRAAMALVSCPTASIGTVRKVDLSDGIAALPEPVDEAGEVLSCGFTSERAYGARAYLIRRPEGNVLVDSPRAAAPLLRRLRELGGVSWLFLTHRDDVADHATFAETFRCRRVLHADDVIPGTQDVEVQPHGREPYALTEDLLMIPVPGHTKGSAALLWQGRLFTGDHLWASDDGERLCAVKHVCWWSWPEQLRSMERLLSYDFEWVIPGHGRRLHAPASRMREMLERLCVQMRRQL